MRILGQASILSGKEWYRLDSTASTKHRTIWAITRYTAARIGETLQLRVGDVYSNPSRRSLLDAITFRKVTRKGKDKNHVVPISASLKRYLQEYDPPIGLDSYLFPGLKDGSHLSYEASLRQLKRSAILAGLDGLRVTTHSGRRTCITNLSRQGTDLRTIQSISGHKSIANLIRYIEDDPSRSLSALDSLNL
jgi:integrase/recombinase XerD